MKATMALEPYEKNIGMMLGARVREFGDRPMLQAKEKSAGLGDKFSIFLWHEIYNQIVLLGGQLLEKGTCPGDRIAILSRNRREMLITELAVMSIGAISVPIFSEYPAPQIAFILSHCGAKILVVDNGLHLNRVITGQNPDLNQIYLMDAGDHASCAAVRPFTDLLRHGDPNDSQREAFERAVLGVNADDPCLIMYTSGTTGQPKGVVLCHRNLLSQQQALKQIWNIQPQDRFLSYLPWHHSFGGLFERFCAIYSGALLTIDDSYGKDLTVLLKNYCWVKPTVYFSVPKIYQALVTEALHDPKVEENIIHPQLKFVFTAAAPLPDDISHYFNRKKIPVIEGWGLTETSPCCTLTQLDCSRQPGYVGFPIPGVEVKLSGQGNILVRGPNVMLGYYRAEEKTRQVLSADGWFNTGDVGEISAQGLKIQGRLDGIFKLSNAEKVSSHHIETTVVSGSRFINACVVGGSGRLSVFGLIVPNFKHLTTWALERHMDTDSMANLLRTRAVRTLFQDELLRLNHLILPKYAQIKGAVLIPRELTLEKEELTPSLKLVRSQIMKNFSLEIDAVYEYSQKKSSGEPVSDETLIERGIILLGLSPGDHNLPDPATV